MDNYEAIMKMNREQLEGFLDCVYCAGLNNGMYYQRQPEGTAEELLDINPFDKAWLESEAEPATICAECEDGDEDMLEAYAEAVLRNAGISQEQDSNAETDKNVSVVMRHNK